jgi:hypothetical protein
MTDGIQRGRQHVQLPRTPTSTGQGIVGRLGYVWALKLEAGSPGSSPPVRLCSSSHDRQASKTSEPGAATGIRPGAGLQGDEPEVWR